MSLHDWMVMPALHALLSDPLAVAGAATLMPIACGALVRLVFALVSLVPTSRDARPGADGATNSRSGG